MTTIKKIRTEKLKIDLIIPDILPMFYADGISHIALGAPTSKIVFYSASAFENEEDDREGIQRREVNLQVTMPVAALVEFAKHILKNVDINKELIDKSLEQYRAKFSTIIDS